MRLNQTLFSVFIFIFLCLTIQCTEDEPAPDSADIIIVNEGNFGQGNGSLSLYDRATDRVENNVFTQVNDGRSPEASVQSVTLADGTAFIVCNTTDKIEIADAATLEAIRAPLEDPGLVSPRYLAVSGNKAYVSVWGPFDNNFALTESKVAVIDLSDYSIIRYIDVAPGPEGIIAVDNQVFVANSFSNVITVIDTNTDEVTEEIILEGSPRLLALDNNELWASVTGASSQFVQINPTNNSVSETISVAGSNSNGKFVINQSQSTIYFIGAEPFPSTVTTVQKLDLDDASGYETLISGDNFYGIGSDPLTNDILVGNSNAFQGEGTVLRYDTEGQLLDTYAVGIGPNGFVF